MKHLKKYNELFGLFSKKEKDDWKSKLEWIFNNYKSDDILRIEAEVEKSASGGESLNISWSKEGDWLNQYNIFSGEKAKDGLNRVATDGEYNEWPVISDEEYKRYKQKIQEISDYLDDTEHLSSSKIGAGELDLDIDENEIKQMMANDELKKMFKDYLNKEYQFEAEYYEWSGPHTNELKVDDIKVTIYDISGSVRGSGKDGKPDFYLMVKCKLGDRKMQFMIDESSATEYIPIKEIPRDDKYSLTLHLYQDEEGLTRKEIRKLKDHGYPHIINYKMVPSDWKSIEFMKECNNLIKIMIDKI